MRYFLPALALLGLLGVACKKEDTKLVAIKAQFDVAVDLKANLDKAQEAYDWLADPKNDAASYMIERLQKDPRKEARMTSAQILGHMKEPRALKPLIKALDDPEALVRHVATRGLSDLGMPEAAPAIFENAKIGVVSKASAMEALGKFKYEPAVPFIVEALTDKSGYNRLSSVRALAKIKGIAAKATIAKLKNDRDSMVRGGVAVEIHKLDPRDPIPGQLVPGLIATLESSDVLDVFDAIRNLGQLDDKRAIKPLMPFLNARASDTRRETVIALTALKAKEALPKIERLQYDYDQDVRIAAGKAVKALK